MTDETRNPVRGAEPPDEERVGELLRRHRALYHDPPATPREAIWSRIEAERRSAGSDGRGARVIPFPRGWWLGTLAVAAVLALGIALGRISMRQEAERQGPAGAPVASADRRGEPRLTEPREPETGLGTDQTVLAEAPSAEAPGGDVAPTPGTPQTEPERRAPVAVAAAPRPAGAEQGPGARPAREPAERETLPAASANDLYRLASQQMLGQAEALLVQYRTDRAAERMDPAIARWARDVLSSTRLLLDSPAAEDPGMRDLLLDLELVLAQIVQRTGGDVVDDELIEQTIEDRDLLPRLRGAIPAGVGAI